VAGFQVSINGRFWVSTEVRQLDQFGFVMKGVNPSINDLIGSSSYYLDVVQTRDHIREHWGRHFEVLEFIDSLAESGSRGDAGGQCRLGQAMHG
jgi:hypothetical protein